MRLGGQECALLPGSLARQIYGKETIIERHRHRYEVNNRYIPHLMDAGMRVSGISANEDLCEMIELTDHPWFVGCQFHPEFTSTPAGRTPVVLGLHPCGDQPGCSARAEAGASRPQTGEAVRAGESRVDESWRRRGSPTSSDPASVPVPGAGTHTQ